MSNDTADQTEYEGSCQCGQVTYTVTCSPLESQPVTTCDCSICTRNGYALIYVPRSTVNWISGYDTLKNFRFAVKVFISNLTVPTIYYDHFLTVKSSETIINSALNVALAL